MKKILRPTIGKRKAMLEQGQKANIIGGLGNLNEMEISNRYLVLKT